MHLDTMAGMEPHIEYATASDGRRIACFAIGAGKPLLISATPPWSHVQQEMRIPAVGAWLRELAAQARLIRYDCRGSGLSDRDGADFSVEAQVRDMEAAADHFGLDSFALWGMIGGSPASIVYAARHPERVSHLLLWGAFVNGAALIKRMPGSEALGVLMRDNWQVYTDVYAQVAFGFPDSETAAGYAQLMRDAITQEAMLQLMRQAAMDVTEEARAVRVPTLVLVRRGATISGVADAREITGLIPSARLLILDGSSHAPFLENPELVTAAIREFIASEHAERAPRPAAVPLTEREHQVLRLLANGRTGKEIAAELAISVPTAQRHIANIYAKIGARGRVEAAAYAFEHGMLPRREA
jgi:pimeloyl-ACP methyl ester carboxylesterase/DNA-binding CsgD family transcriptional regulator